MTIYLFLYLFCLLAGLHKCFMLDLYEKNGNMGLGPTLSLNLIE